MLVIPESVQEQVEWRPGVVTRLRAGGSLGSQRLCVLEQWHEPGRGAPAHSHPGAEELLMVLSGDAEVWIEDERTTVGRGSMVVVPPSVVHGFRNVGSDRLHVLAVLSAAEPLVVYEDEPGTVLVIAGRGDVRRDAHRAVRTR